jgi:mono/diheme cytochrome c family protein
MFGHPSRRSLAASWAGLCLAGAGLAACDNTDLGPERLGLGKTSLEANQLERGRRVYATYCVGCHGENGDGAGPAARFLDPKPRDFRLGRIKFAAVASGEAPRDEDYVRIISHGLSGTAMPNFDLLSAKDKAAVIAYVKTFYTGWKDDGPSAPITVGKDPFADDPKGGVEAGRRAYHGLAKCWSCHPAYVTASELAEINKAAGLPVPELRPNAYQSESKESQWGAPITPPDFLVDRVKTGLEIDTLAHVIGSGVGGTAMPTWAGSLDNDQIWGLAYYVRSLALERGTPESKQLRARLEKSITSSKAAQ